MSWPVVKGGERLDPRRRTDLLLKHLLSSLSTASKPSPAVATVRLDLVECSRGDDLAGS
jgi:hypothetical protein